MGWMRDPIQMGHRFWVAKVACGWSEVEAQPLFDVCDYGGHGGYGGLSVAMGLMRPTANGGPFLGCRGWMWVVCGQSMD